MANMQFLVSRSLPPLLLSKPGSTTQSILRCIPTLLVLTIALTHPLVARAGLYNTAEPDEGPLDPNYIKFGETLNVLRSLGADKVEVERPLRKRYLLQFDLFNSLDPGKLSAEHKLN